MARSAACLAAVIPTALAAVLVPIAPAAVAAPDDVEQALTVSLESMTPSAVPRRGRITLTGEVTNTSDDTWTDIQAYLFTSSEPITTADGLSAAAETDPAIEVGGRLTREGLFDEVGDLEPGESTSYSVSVARKDLSISGEPGAYWIGVHVLGAVDGVRDGFAAGRARSFIPLMTPRGPDAELALVVPFRERVMRDSDGTLLGLPRWQGLLASDGRLGQLASLAAESDRPLSLIVDPAVLDAARSVAADNPPFTTSDDGSGAERGGASESPAPSESESPSEDPETPAPVEDGEPVEPSPEALQAESWLASFVDSADRSTVLALPYGDVDVAAVTTNRLDRILQQAFDLSDQTLNELEVGSAPVVAPPTGRLPARSLDAVDPGTPVVLADAAFPDFTGAALNRPSGPQVALTDSEAGIGGPGPDDRTHPVALRQRILAEAAVRALEEPDAPPLVVSTPQRWDPGPSWRAADFFDGLDVPWLRQVDLNQVLAGAVPERVSTAPEYPQRQAAKEVPFPNQLATQELIRTGAVYAELLADNESVRVDVAKAAMLASSYSARPRPGAALTRARGTTLRIRRTMRLVDIDGPPFVMMSSERGPIAVTVVNNLDDPVTVKLEAVTQRDDLTIKDSDPITLRPGQRTPVRLRAETSAIGVHPVTLRATTESGEPLGSEVVFTVRTSNVGFVVWLVMGIGGALLLVMVGFRIVRRVRARRGSAAPEHAA